MRTLWCQLGWGIALLYPALWLGTAFHEIGHLLVRLLVLHVDTEVWICRTTPPDHIVPGPIRRTGPSLPSVAFKFGWNVWKGKNLPLVQPEDPRFDNCAVRLNLFAGSFAQILFAVLIDAVSTKFPAAALPAFAVAFFGGASLMPHPALTGSTNADGLRLVRSGIPPIILWVTGLTVWTIFFLFFLAAFSHTFR